MLITQSQPVTIVVARLVRDELNASVARCSALLEQLAGSTVSLDGLESLERELAQLRGAMAILSLAGGQRLIESLMEAARLLPDREGRDRKRLAGQVSQGLLALPLYFDHLLRTGEEVPALLISLINDIRAEAGLALLPETTFATEAFLACSLPDTRGAGHCNIETLEADLPRLRHMFSAGLLGLLRQRHQRISQRLMLRACGRLRELLAGTPMEWQCSYAEALLEASLLGQMENTQARKRLWMRFEQRLRQLAHAPASVSHEAVDEDWLRQVFYLVALSGIRQGPAANLLQVVGDTGPWTDFRLVQERRRMFGKTTDTVQSIARELGLEMGRAKRLVEQLMSKETPVSDTLRALGARLKQVADAVNMAGLPEAHDVLWDTLHQLKGWYEADETPSEEAILAMADTLLFVESRFAEIDGFVPAGAEQGGDQLFLVSRRQLLDAQKIVVHECLAGLHRSKALVSDYIENSFDETRLGDLSGILTEVRGGLVMLGLTRPAGILQAATRFVVALRAEKVAATDLPRMLAALADVLVTLEHYLEEYEISRQADDNLMQVAEKGLEVLGYVADVTAVS